MFKVIVAGCGSIANKWLANLTARDDVQIVALVDPVRENALAHKERHELPCRVFPDLAQALAETQASLLIDTTPPAMHEEIVVRGLESGLDVFGEKPMADSMQAARNILAAVDASGKRYFVMQNRRYLHGIQTLRQTIESGVVGAPYHVFVDMRLGAHFTGFRNEMEHPLIIDMAIHTFDEARYLLGDARAVSAYCQEYNPPHSWYRGAAAADCIFEMNSGSIFLARLSWVSRSENTSSHGKWHVSCTEGAALWDGYGRVSVNVAQALPENRSYYEEEGILSDVSLCTAGREEHDGCLDDMFSALLSDQSMQTDCHNNIHSLAMVHACLESSKTGRKVYL
ncbi:MAG: Gfo/Idh/MocA family oxidoreductase [Bacillota bacterium]|nr:Gfo/Idh/MocA family oxidoreductase [Bacillota bacterium]